MKAQIYTNDKGQYHREDGPAIIWSDGTQYWCINGKIHREDGPAIITRHGTQFWYMDGISYTGSEYYTELYRRGKITEGELFLKLL